MKMNIIYMKWMVMRAYILGNAIFFFLMPFSQLLGQLLIHGNEVFLGGQKDGGQLGKTQVTEKN